MPTPAIPQLYAVHDALTDPGGYACLYDDLTANPAALQDVVSRLMIHVSWADKYDIPPDTAMQRDTLPVAERLRQIQLADAGALTVVRPPPRRTFGTCRDFALLFC